ncbi:unnamed protein product, partial [Tetraodon nigroviridis]
EKQSLPGDREPAVKRAFKSFVEERDDKFTMELLLLPSALKEELLGLVHSAAAGPTPAASAALALPAGARTLAAPIVLDPSEGDDGEAVSPETNLRCLVNFFRWVVGAGPGRGGPGSAFFQTLGPCCCCC